MLLPADHVQYAGVSVSKPQDKEKKQDKEKQVGGSTSLLRAVFNLTKSAIGLGALFLPGNMKRMGLLGCTAMICIAAAACTLSLHFLSRASARTRTADYFGLGVEAAGPGHARFVAAALVLFQVGGLIAYAAFAGQYMSGALGFFFLKRSPAGTHSWWFMSPEFLSCVLSAAIVFPLSCMRDMSRIANASIAGMLCVMYIVVLTVADYFVAVSRGAFSRDITLWRVQSDFLNTFSSIMFAFVNQFTLVSLVPAMERPTPRRRALLVWLSSAVVTACYVAMGVTGYLHFGNAVTPDILTAPRQPGLAYALGRLAMSLVLLASYPLQCDPTRTACDQLLLECTKGFPSVAARPRVRHYLWTAFLVGMPCAIAVTLRAYVMPILEVFSSACGSLLIFILPSYYFLTLLGKRGAPVHKGEIVLAYTNVVVGAVVLVGGTVGAVIDMVKQFRRL